MNSAATGLQIRPLNQQQRPDGPQRTEQQQGVVGFNQQLPSPIDNMQQANNSQSQSPHDNHQASLPHQIDSFNNNQKYSQQSHFQPQQNPRPQQYSGQLGFPQQQPLVPQYGSPQLGFASQQAGHSPYGSNRSSFQQQSPQLPQSAASSPRFQQPTSDHSPQYQQPGPPPSRFQQSGPLTPHFQQSGPPTPQFQQPGPPTPQFQQPGPPTPQFQQPGPPTPQFQQPGPQTPQFQQPGPPTPQFQQPGPPTPQFQQPGPPTPQFQQASGPVPQYQPHGNLIPQLSQPLAPQFGMQQQLTQQFNNMSVQQASAFNILSGPPPAWNMYGAHTGPFPSENSVSGNPNSNCHPTYKCCTLNAVPNSSALLNKTKLPFGLIISPYKSLQENEEPVPVINPASIVRCRKCRTYINPWVQFVDQGTRWKCNLCYLTNEVPSFFDWDPNTNQQLDRMQRPELSHGVVEFIAPQEYMVRPPQPVVILFVIDVSFTAVKSGMVAVAARTILDSLDTIPNTNDRTKVAFITVDSSIHFYNFNSAQSEPQMLVVSDLEGEPYLPCPCDLLVTLSESRNVIEAFLERLGDMFKDTQITANVLGRALQFGYKMITSIGGKIVVLQSSLPSSHDGQLKSREDPALLGTPKEIQLLLPATQFYKGLALDCSRSQICIDVFLFNSQYADVATLSGCAKHTGGAVYYYPQFNSERMEDTLKFANELSHFLGRPIGLEAVLRVRATRGIQMSCYYGNFFLRSTDLLQLPNVNPDNSFAIEMTIDENLSGSIACFQTALLHTSSSGERRIRVLTLALPITGSIPEIFASADPRALSTLLTKKAIERALTAKLEDAREAVLFKLIEIMGAFKTNCTSSGQAVQLLVPDNLRLFPVLILGLLKSMALRDTNNVPSDMRSYIMSAFYVSSVETNTAQIYPRFCSLHNLDPEALTIADDGSLIMPPFLNLGSEKLERHGIYLLENGQEMFLWIGKAVQPDLCMMLFDRPYESLQGGKCTLPVIPNEFNSRVNALVDKVRQYRTVTATLYPHLYLVKEDGDPALRQWFLSFLAEDRQSEAMLSYPQFLQYLKEHLAGVNAN